MALVRPRSCASAALAALVGVLGCAEEEKNTPPISEVTQGLGSAGVTAGGGIDTGGPGPGGTDTDSRTTGDTGADTGGQVDTGTGTATSGGTTGTTGVDGSAFEGQLWLTEGRHDLPLECTVYFYSEDAVDPQTGTVVGEPEMFATLMVEAWPHLFAIGWDHATPNVAPGDTGFVGVACDVDGDLTLDESVGGWYPRVPLEPITAPATDLVIEIGPL
jgi:hypothetical protein